VPSRNETVSRDIVRHIARFKYFNASGGRTRKRLYFATRDKKESISYFSSKEEGNEAFEGDTIYNDFHLHYLEIISMIERLLNLFIYLDPL